MSSFSNPVGAATEAAQSYISALLELLGDRDPLEVKRELLPALRALTAGLSPDELRHPEARGKWSVIQVVEHITDQETVNAFRLRSIVAEERPPLRGYDQDAWATRLRYGDAGLEGVLEELDILRRRNLRLWEALDENEMERIGVHSERGEESLRRMLALTAGHDLVHRRQIARIRAAIGRPVGQK